MDAGTRHTLVTQHSHNRLGTAAAVCLNPPCYMIGFVQYRRTVAGLFITKAASVHCVGMRPVCARRWQKTQTGAGYQA